MGEITQAQKTEIDKGARTDIRKQILEARVTDGEPDMGALRRALAEKYDIEVRSVTSIGAWLKIFADQVIDEHSIAGRIAALDLWKIAHVTFSAPPASVRRKRQEMISAVAREGGLNAGQVEAAAEDFEAALAGSKPPKLRKSGLTEISLDGTFVRESLAKPFVASIAARISGSLQKRGSAEAMRDFFEMLGAYGSYSLSHWPKQYKRIVDVLGEGTFTHAELEKALGARRQKRIQQLLEAGVIETTVSEKFGVALRLNPLLRALKWAESLPIGASSLDIEAGIAIRAKEVGAFCRKLQA